MLPNTQMTERTVNFPFLEVHSIWETIQGEGPLVGTPAVFIRLSGCNLQCPKCDTDYTSQRMKLDPKAILDYITAHFPRRIYGLVVFTGGEPFRQRLLFPVNVLLGNGYKVQIETNGTLFDQEFFARKQEHIGAEDLLIVCSPKAGINQMLVPFIDTFKYVVEHGYVDGEDGLPTRALGSDCGVGRPPSNFPRDKIYIQPCDEGHPEGNKRNMDAAIESCMKFGYRLCLQVHKIAGLK